MKLADCNNIEIAFIVKACKRTAAIVYNTVIRIVIVSALPHHCITLVSIANTYSIVTNSTDILGTLSI